MSPKVILVTNMPVHHQVDLINAIAEEGKIDLHTVFLRRMSAGRSWRKRPEIRGPHTYLPEIRIKGHWYFNWPLGGLLRAVANADLVVFGQYASVTMQLCMYWLRLFHRQVPWVFWSEPIWGFEFDAQPLLRSQRLRRIFRKVALRPVRNWSSELWAIGSDAESSFRGVLRLKKVRIVPYSSDLAAFFALRYSRDPSSKFTFCFCGSASVRKGFDVVVRAVRILTDQGHRDFVIRVVGSGPILGDMESSIKPFFDQRGFVEHDQIPLQIEGSDVVLVPSRYDGWGMSLVEGLAAGIPVIASTAVGVANQILRDNENGWLVPPGDSHALAASMMRCIQDQQRLAGIGVQARESAAEYDVHRRYGAVLFSSSALEAIHG